MVVHDSGPPIGKTCQDHVKFDAVHDPTMRNSCFGFILCTFVSNYAIEMKYLLVPGHFVWKFIDAWFR